MANQVTDMIIVKGDTAEVFSLWANFENFPHFMENIKSVVKTGDRTSHWVMEGPLGGSLEWDAETTRLEPHARIAWNSRDSGDITTSGQVVFTPLANGETQVTATLQYVPPAGKLGEAMAKLFDNPAGRLRGDLQRFKEYAERTMGSQQQARERNALI